MQLGSNTIFLSAACVFAVVAAVCDIKSRRIPNLLTGPAIVFGLGLHLYLDGMRGLLSACAACLVCGAIFLIFHLAGGMGAGDVKLIAAVGCIAGLTSTAELLVLTSLAGGIMAVCYALMRGSLKRTLANVAVLVTHHAQAGPIPHPEINVKSADGLRLPYGVAIAAGCIATFCLQQVNR